MTAAGVQCRSCSSYGVGFTARADGGVQYVCAHCGADWIARQAPEAAAPLETHEAKPQWWAS
jgi:DNA-directed RNA polymerase subunit RPC12/RpoP